MEVNKPPFTIEKFKTGLHSLDCLFRGGFPYRSIFEIAGMSGIGKTTLALFLASVSNKSGTIKLVDLENSTTEDYLMATLPNYGFDGTVDFSALMTTGGDAIPHEDILDEVMLNFYDNNVSAQIIDSVGAIVPTSEKDNSLGEANMGSRARLLHQANRKYLIGLRDSTPKILIWINHVYKDMGGYGMISPGGNSLDFSSAVRMRLSKKEIIDDFIPVVEVRSMKNRFGGRADKDRAYLVIVPGKGVSTNLTAVFDCFHYGLAKRSKYISVIGEGGELIKVDTLKNLVKADIDGDVDMFNTFYEAINNFSPTVLEEAE